MRFDSTSILLCFRDDYQQITRPNTQNQNNDVNSSAANLDQSEKFKTNLDVDFQIEPRVDRMKQEYRICLERFKKTGNISEECGQDISQD
jgi:hypothetical protein